VYASFKKLLWSWLSLKFIIATNNLLLDNRASTAVKLWQSHDKLYIWLCILFISFFIWNPHVTYTCGKRWMCASDLLLVLPRVLGTSTMCYDERWDLFCPELKPNAWSLSSWALFIPTVSNPHTTKPNCRGSSLHGWHTPPGPKSHKLNSVVRTSRFEKFLKLVSYLELQLFTQYFLQNSSFGSDGPCRTNGGEEELI
jgi:hypothetical protein